MEEVEDGLNTVNDQAPRIIYLENQILKLKFKALVHRKISAVIASMSLESC